MQRAHFHLRGTRVAVACLALLSLTLPAAAAERWDRLVGTVFQNYGREQGLPPVVPTSLAQDGDGFLWIGTQGGLIRWDGYRFREYDAKPGPAQELPGGWIDVLHTDTAGQLWLGTDADGLARYDRDQDRFIPVPVGPAAGDRHHIGAIADEGAAGLWIGTDEGLYRLDHGKASMVAGLPGDKIQAVLHDHTGRLWVGTDRGLVRRDAGADAFSAVPLAVEAGDPVLVSVLFEDGDGRVWIGTTQHGLYVADPGTSDARAVAEQQGAGSTLQTDRVTAIVAAGEHEIWVSTRATGIVTVDTATGQIRRIRHDKLVPSSLGHDDVWSMLRDRAGSLWIGSAGGLSYHPHDLDTVSTVFGDTMRPNGITDPDIASILSTKDGRIWLGFLTGGVDIIDPAVGRVAQLRPDPGRPDAALPQDVVTEMAEAANGDVYIGTVRGLYRADGAGRGITLVHPAGRDPHAFVRTLLLDGTTLWIGGPNGLWGMPLDPAAAGGSDPTNVAALGDQSVFTLLRGPHELWIGTLNGLYRLDLASGAVETVLAEPGNPTALPARIVSGLLTDRQGRLWVGTFGGGIGVMTGRDGTGRPQFRRIGAADGLPHLNVDKLLLDAVGMVWASTDDGLAVIDPDDFKTRPIQRANGAALTVYWVKSGATDLAGEPMFGAKGGLAVVQPGWPATWTLQAPVVVSDVRIGGKSVAGGRFNGAGSTTPLVLTPDTNSLAVEFAALDFTAPERNRYAYRLEGFDRSWIETDATRRLAAYTNLPPGDYVLKLRGSNRDGVWTQPEREIPVHVMPAWYQTLRVRLALVAAVMALALAAMAAFVGRRTATLRRRQGELERQIANRTADLQAANERLSELATTDPLTGCGNRRHFIERAHELMELGRRGMPMSLAIMDLDHFKLINDSHGHPIGDEVLRLAGRTARDQVRVSDLIGRIGGEEFAVLMPNTRAAAALVLADRLRAALADAELRVGDLTIRATASLGLAEQREGEDFDGLYARADAALYAAKEGGRNRVVLASDTPVAD